MTESETAPTIAVKRRGLMLVLSSPSGAGKSTISKRLLESETNLSMSISATTRPMRPGETDGKDYHFISEQEFHEMVQDGTFLEHAKVFGNFYGTLKGPVEDLLSAGKDVLFDIDWQGAQQVSEHAGSDVVKVFVLPPSTKELERRLHTRAQDSEQVVRDRMAKAAGEITHWAEYDYIVINDDLENAVTTVHSVLLAERARRERLTNLSSFVDAILQH